MGHGFEPAWERDPRCPNPIAGYSGSDGRGRTFPPPIFEADDAMTAFLTGRVVAAVLDNLGKGAAGQAVQNMNIMLGLPEGTGLEPAAW